MIKKFVKSVTKPVTKVLGKATDVLGITDIKGQKEAERAVEVSRRESEIATAKLKENAEREQRLLGQQMAARRRARRSGKGLLSDARLNAEVGVETLGGGNNLG